MSEEQKHTLEERIAFVAKHYRENSLDVEKAWHKFASERHIRRVFRFPAWAKGMAAAMLLLIAFGCYLIYRNNQPEWVLITSASGKVTEVYLPDSSHITLASGSELRYDAKSFGDAERWVEMKGKAFYRVKRLESCPFTVSAQSTRVTVLGTSFLVREDVRNVEVQVKSGRVRFEAGNHQELLTAGMSARYSDEEQQIQVEKEENENLLSWQNRELVFRDTPLPRVIHDLELCYDVRITNRKSASDSLCLTATFRDMSLDEALTVINQTLDIALKEE